MSLKKQIEGHFEGKDKRSTIRYRRILKKAGTNGYAVQNALMPVKFVKAGNTNNHPVINIIRVNCTLSWSN
jgi:hypothetical protein